MARMWMAALVALVAARAVAEDTPGAAKLPYQDDPAILKALDGLGDRASMVLPPLKVECGDLKMGGFRTAGPGQRDYCNKMPYAPERRTALYAGGNHGGPHRMNDVWEYHLGSNTWHLLWGPDGGNPGQHKPAWFLITRTLSKTPDMALTDQQKKDIDALKDWWLKNVVLKDGHLTTQKGGPISCVHTWDAFVYDARARRLVWGNGVSPMGDPVLHSRFTGTPLEDVKRQLDPTYTPLWMFDPYASRWIHYRTAKPHAKLNGMGATMCYVPDLGKSVWYVAAENVTPAAYEMFLYDAVADEWTELKPNGGKRIGELAAKAKVAPMSEQQTAYSARHKKIVAVLGKDTFVYDVAKNEWSKAASDDRLRTSDAESVFAYDSAADVFLLACPESGKKLRLAAFSLETGKWEFVTPQGPGIPVIQYGSYMGYYDERLNVFVVQGRGSNTMWVYRHKRKA